MRFLLSFKREAVSLQGTRESQLPPRGAALSWGGGLGGAGRAPELRRGGRVGIEMRKLVPRRHPLGTPSCSSKAVTGPER